MKEIIFLKKLKRTGKLALVEPSEEIKSSYIIKAENCMKASRILFKNELYDNSTSEAYYCIYNSLLALLFKIGIKSENHSASIIIFDKLFGNKSLTRIISWAKEERIDKQYYVETQKTIKSTRESCKEMITEAEDFLVNFKVITNELNNQQIEKIRKSFEELFSLTDPSN